MSCTTYKAAVDAAKEAVIHALNVNEETNTLSELWRHYLGLRHIADNHKHVDEDTISFNFDGIGAAQPVNYYDYFGGQDVISFSGASSPDTITFGDTVIQGGAGTDVLKL